MALPLILAALAVQRRAKRRAAEAAALGSSDSAKGDNNNNNSAACAKVALPQEPLPVLLGLWGPPSKPAAALEDAELGGTGHTGVAPRQASLTRADSAKRSDPSSHALDFAEASSQVGALPFCACRSSAAGSGRRCPGPCRAHTQYDMQT